MVHGIPDVCRGPDDVCPGMQLQIQPFSHRRHCRNVEAPPHFGPEPLSFLSWRVRDVYPERVYGVVGLERPKIDIPFDQTAILPSECHATHSAPTDSIVGVEGIPERDIIESDAVESMDQYRWIWTNPLDRTPWVNTSA